MCLCVFILLKGLLLSEVLVFEELEGLAVVG